MQKKVLILRAHFKLKDSDKRDKMEVKKSPKVNLEKQKAIFIQMGLVVSLGFMFIAFEWTQSDLKKQELTMIEEVALEEEAIPVTRQEEIKPPPPPPPPKFTDVLNIVEDDIDLEEELEIEDTEISEDTEIEIIDIGSDEDEEVEDAQVFMVVEQMPSFPGGDAALMKYLGDNVKYPAIAQEHGIQGRVYVSFVVSKDGTIRDVTVGRSVDPALDNEAIRVVKTMPKWTPGKQRGKSVNVKYMLPVNFVLQ